MALLSKDDAEKALTLYGELQRLRTARDAGESYYGIVELTLTRSASVVHTVEVEKEAGLAIINNMISAVEAQLTSLGFQP